MAIKTRKRYSKGGRLDMRKGGRVGFNLGGTYSHVRDKDSGVWMPHHTNDQSGTHEGSDVNTSSSSPDNPFPDTGDIPYGATTEEQATTARTQIEEAAEGIVPEEAKIKTPAALKTDDPKFTGEGNFDFSVDWQKGGNIGKYSKTAGGQTAEDLFKAIYAGGGDSVAIGNRTYGWEDFHNLINQDKALHGTAKPSKAYEADATLMGDDATSATAGTVGTAPSEAVSVVPSQVYTEEFIKANEGTIAKNAQGFTADQILRMTVDALDMPAGQNYTVQDALKLLQEEKTFVGKPNPLFAAQTQEGVTAEDAKVKEIAYKKDASGNLITDAQGNPIPATPKITAATSVDAEGKADITQEATATRINDLTLDAVAAGMPEDEALIKAKAEVITGTLSAGSAIEGGPTGVGGQVSETPEAERSEREKIIGSVANGDADQIEGVPTLQAAERQSTKGTERTRAAKAMIEKTADLPPDISAAIISDPVFVTAQMDNADVNVVAAIAALPETALVSVQMEGLLAGIEDGVPPIWARPAVAAVQDMMAQRGLDVSTVARDSLFNAIIQTALPMAQSNAQALQQRATQNLSNQQQANLAQAQQDMQRRMTNLANQQTAESQSAQMATNIAIQQGTFEQQAGIKSAELQQQTYTQNLANQQEASRITAQQEQQAQMANLSNEQQMEVLNLQIEADEFKDEFGAEQQVRLAKFQTAADFMAKNIVFKNDMEKANLSKDVQVELANLQSKNRHESELMSNDEKIELANLEAKMRVGITNANLANSMGIAQLSSDQAIAMQNAQVIAGMDMADFSAAQQTQLANSKFVQSITMQDFSQEQQAAMQNATSLASLDMATVDQRTKLAITNAQNFLQMDMANLNNEQQSFIVEAQMRQQALLSDQAAYNAGQQFNAASQNQLDQYMTGLAQQVELTNKQRNDAMSQFNVTQENAAEARRAGNEQQANMLEAQMGTDVSKFNDQQDYNREQFNTQQSNAIEQFNVNWRRDANKIDTAAINAVNQQNAQNAFGLSTQAMSFMWQELRDQMDYSFKTYDNDQQRKASLIVAALGNEAAAGEDGWSDNWLGFSTLITSMTSS